MNIKKYIPSQLLINDKIKLPNNFTQVKIDIGLSHNAPNSEVWLNRNPNSLIVFGFEPNPKALNILRGYLKRDEKFEYVLSLDKLNNNFFLIPLALGNENKSSNFYSVTSIDCGVSSLYKPTQWDYTQFQVPQFKLDTFLELFPFNQIPYISHIKIDAQGHDWNIIKGMVNHLNKIAYISYAWKSIISICSFKSS
jgi:FkbM family methyltransferase